MIDNRNVYIEATVLGEGKFWETEHHCRIVFGASPTDLSVRWAIDDLWRGGPVYGVSSTDGSLIADLTNLKFVDSIFEFTNAVAGSPRESAVRSSRAAVGRRPGPARIGAWSTDDDPVA